MSKGYYLYLSLVKVSIVLLLGLSICIYTRLFDSPLFSLLSIILPYLYILEIIYLSFGLLSPLTRNLTSRCLIVILSGAFILWPPSWIYQKPILDLSPPIVSITNWNVARMGELSTHTTLEQSRTQTLKCVVSTLKKNDADLLLLQEVSKRNLKAIQKEQQLYCRHIDYYGTGELDHGGLAICSKKQGRWKINFARDLKLSGSWRALFAEIEMNLPSTTSTLLISPRFNLLNVHFLPHRIGPKAVKKVVNALTQGSIFPLGDLTKQILTTIEQQQQQAKTLMSMIQTFKDPTVLGGDFNSPPDSLVHWALGENWVDVWAQKGTTFGATRYFGGWIPLRVDFIYVSTHSFEVGEAKVIPASCSDHLPIQTSLRLVVAH